MKAKAKAKERGKWKLCVERTVQDQQEEEQEKIKQKSGIIKFIIADKHRTKDSIAVGSLLEPREKQQQPCRHSRTSKNT